MRTRIPCDLKQTATAATIMAAETIPHRIIGLLMLVERSNPRAAIFRKNVYMASGWIRFR
jgi:hypothetical protein